MDAYSYPDSTAPSTPSVDTPINGDASPASWEQSPTRLPTPAPASSSGLRLMVSYGGLIQPRPFDHKLYYSGGHTKLIVLERSLRFPAVVSRLASVLVDASPAEIQFKYQLPGEDLDALVSVTNDEDLDHMIFEHDRLPLPNAPKHLRLFLYPVGPLPPPPSAAFLETPAAAASPSKPERQCFVDALNSTSPAPIQVQPKSTQNSPDFLSGPDGGIVSPPAAKVKDPLVDALSPKTDHFKEEDFPKTQLPSKDGEADGSVQGGVPPLDALQEQLQSAKIADNIQQQPTLSPVIPRNASEESLSARSFRPQPEYYLPTAAALAANWCAASGRFPSLAGGDQAMFLIPASLASGVYPAGMAAAGQGYYTGQGYFAGVQKVVPAEVSGQGGAYPPSPAPPTAAATYAAGYDVAGRAVYYTTSVPAYQTATMNQVDAAINAVKPSQVS